MKLLTDTRVVEVASVITGPLAGMLLADMGADVIKVESPRGGDSFRGWHAGIGGPNPSFTACNHGKRSVTLDLKDEKGKEAYRRLVETADLVIENSRPGVMDRLGVGWDDLRTVNPRLVYCYISGLGSEGPDRNAPTFDAVAQAYSGLWSQMTDLADPEAVGPALADQLTGLYAASAALAALHHARRTGEGTRVEVSMLAACLAFEGLGICTLLSEGTVPGKTTRARQSQSYAFVSSDDLPLAAHLSTPQKFWEGFCRAVERPDLIDDPRFSSKALRIEHYDELHDLLAPVFRTQPRSTWLERLREHDVPSAPILDLGEAVEHPQVHALGVIKRGDIGRNGTGGRVLAPILVGSEYCAAELGTPNLGEDTDDVLASIGLTEDEIADLRTAGVLA